jgi:hypothetical protein
MTKTPANIQRESLGFVFYIASFILLALFFLWALNPSSSLLISQKIAEEGSLEWILGAILSALPSSDVTLYFPAIVVWIVCMYGSAYALLNLLTTPSLDDLCTLYDAYSKPFRHSKQTNLKEGFDKQELKGTNREFDDDDGEEVKKELNQDNSTLLQNSSSLLSFSGPPGAAKVLTMLLQGDETARQSARQEEIFARKLVATAASTTTTSTTTEAFEGMDRDQSKKKQRVRMPTRDVADLPVTIVNRVMFGAYR